MNIALAARHNHLLRRVGIAGFTFFLIKGLLWLAAPFIFMWFM